jgi:hypothetical protein
VIALSRARALWRRAPSKPRPIVPAVPAQRSGRDDGSSGAAGPSRPQVVRVVEALAVAEARRRFHADQVARVAAAPRTS